MTLPDLVSLDFVRCGDKGDQEVLVGKVIVVNNVSLDGVMQAPAAPDEDQRGGFEHGGWTVPYGDEVMRRRMGEAMTGQGSLLLGRRTYQHFYAVWPSAPQPNPYTDRLNKIQKYVVSNTLSEPLPWVNSKLLSGDGAGAVTRLKQELPADQNLCVLGSGVLLHSLIACGLVDEYLLLIHPLTLGRGLRLFPENVYAPLRLVESITTTTGVVIATYRSGASPVEQANRPPVPAS